MQRIELVENWQFKERVSTEKSSLLEDFASADNWLPATVPGSVQQDLLAHGLIPDPFFGLNETAVAWVGENDWLYHCSFDLGAELLAAQATVLVLEGLDTFATVWLNGQQILRSDNMFVPYRLSVKNSLQAGKNELFILFESALQQGKELEQHYGKLTAWNGNPSRVYVRKAQYHYGWDWGPAILTVGPWRKISLEVYNSRIADLACPLSLTPDLTQASLNLKLELELESTSAVALHLELYRPNSSLLEDVWLNLEGSPTAATHLTHLFEINYPELWWPNGYGEPALYRVVASLHLKNNENNSLLELDQRELKLGIRTLELVQEPLQDEKGNTFLFKVNNLPVFCAGANWIPADSFVSHLSESVYRDLLIKATQANMVMIRVWGGGIYEADVFYNLCDELGLLVWQDFMFACGIYPAYPEFQASVVAEAEAAVRRLRHHACLTLWCGNNEDYQVAQSLNAYDVSFEGDFTLTDFPARHFYERLLPEICAKLDPARPYWPGSPYGGTDVFDKTVGDRHTWEIWHGKMADYHEYPHWEGRFISEFGMEACPALSTIETFTTEAERYPQSRSLEHHNKSVDGTRRLAVYLNDNLRVSDKLEDYIYATQFVQAEALAQAYQGWRRRWHGPGRYAVAGALVWQLNDCWPVTSWSIIDYAQRPKPAYYVIRRELAPQVVGLRRLNNKQASLWVANSTNQPFKADLELTTWTLAGEMVSRENRSGPIAANGATELGEIAINLEEVHILSACLYVEGQPVARASLWPEPFKYLQLPDPQIQLDCLSEHTLQIQSSRPAKGVWLEAETGEGFFSDNMLDLMPGEIRLITVSAINLYEQKLKIRWLGSA